MPRVKLSDQTVLDIGLFVIPVLASFEINLMGQLLVSDLVVPFFMIAALIVRGPTPSKVAYFTIFAAIMWFAALIVSDIIRETAPSDYLRGWARNGLACMYLIFFSCAARPTPRSLGLLASGVVIALLAAASRFPHVDFAFFMKFYGGAALAWATCALAMKTWQSRRPNVLLPVLVVLVGMAIAANTRSVMVIVFVTTILMFASANFSSVFRRMSMPVMIVTLAIGGGIVTGALVSGYSYLADSGMLGRHAQEKYLLQSKGGTLETIWNARAELRVAIDVIEDSPLLGHGSWYRDPRIAAAELFFTNNYQTMGNAAGLYQAVSSGNQATGHSAILQAWVETGVLGALFWAWVIGVCVAAILRSIQRPTVISPLLYLAACWLIWDSLFSPFAGALRVTNMAELAIVLIGLRASSKQRQTATQISRHGRQGSWSQVAESVG